MYTSNIRFPQSKDCPENVQRIKVTAQKAGWWKTKFYKVFRECEPGEKKTALYGHILSIQYIIDRAMEIAREWHGIDQIRKYTRELEERYDREDLSLKAALNRVEKAYKELEEKG